MTALNGLSFRVILQIFAHRSRGEHRLYASINISARLSSLVSRSIRRAAWLKTCLNLIFQMELFHSFILTGTRVVGRGKGWEMIGWIVGRKKEDGKKERRGGGFEKWMDRIQNGTTKNSGPLNIHAILWIKYVERSAGCQACEYFAGKRKTYPFERFVPLRRN